MIALTLIIAALGVGVALWIASPLARGAAGPMHRLVAFGVMAVLAIAALGAYLVGGQPGLEGQPYAATEARLAELPPEDLTAEEQEERLRAIVRREPGNPEALAMLGRFLAFDGRHLEAIAMLERSARVREDARVFSDLGQALVNLNEGTVTPEAERAFAAAMELDETLPEPAFFMGAAAYDAGDREAALGHWAGIVGRLPEDDPFRQAIAVRAADLLSRPAGGPQMMDPDALDPDESPDAMVARMVAGLEAGLEAYPDDLTRWMVLARVRAVREDRDGARAAIAEARARSGGDAGTGAILDALERAGGLDAEAEGETE
ncbi:tetratricopeptide repeat protein [Glycocaulis sp.]|uniref:tetratricopeptide repeat protein n=1 Tax=Glycocaulis sp. TaxID=1969725 RepID=UPI003D1C7388